MNTEVDTGIILISILSVVVAIGVVIVTIIGSH